MGNWSWHARGRRKQRAGSEQSVFYCRLPLTKHEPVSDDSHDILVRIEAKLDLLLQKGPPSPIGVLSSSGDIIDFRFERMPTAEELESAYIRYVLSRCAGNKTIAAETLGLDPSTLYRKLARLETGT